MECDKPYEVHKNSSKIKVITKDKINDSKEEEANLLLNKESKNNPGTSILSSTSLYERCHVCNKKLRTCVLQCKCKQYFCSAHISNFNHNCSFDFKKHNQDLLRERNPIICANKI